MAVPKRRRIKKSKPEYFQDAAQEYMKLYGVTEFDPEEVAQWMVDTGRYDETPRSKVKRCKQELVKHLRAQRVTDPQGRDVRGMLGARYKNEQGELWSKWSPTYEAKPEHARLALQQWKRSFRGEAVLHDRTTRSYNDNNIWGAQLPLFDYNMNKDIAEANLPESYPDERPIDAGPEDASDQRV